MIVLAIGLTAAAATLGAAPASSFLPAAAASALAAGAEARSVGSGRGAAPSMLPIHPAAAELARSIAAESPDIIVEAAFLWRKPRRAAPEAETLAIYNVLRSVGSLQGIEYYSASRKRMRLFYEYSSLVAGPGSDAPVPDSRLAALPTAPETLYARQRDLSFGDNRYEITMRSGGDYVAQSSVNLTPMSYGPIPVAGARDLNVKLLVISADDALVFYAASSAKAAVIPGVRGKLESSFGNRAAAVYAWFSRRLGETWP